MTVHPVEESQIVEIDTIKELSDIDSTYKSMLINLVKG